VLTWSSFKSEQPELAAAGKALLYQHGVGLAFLATVRGDGRPRLHPFCPLFADDRLFAFIVPSPKQADLRRDGWYSLHSFPSDDNEDAFYMSGHACVVTDDAVRRSVSAQFVDERSQFAVPEPAPDHVLFEFDLDHCLLTTTTGHGDGVPRHQVWHLAKD